MQKKLGIVDDREPGLMTSSRRGSVVFHGYRDAIEIHRTESEKDARDAALRTIGAEGAIAFMRGDNVDPFRRL